MPVTVVTPKKKSSSAFDPIIAGDQLKALLYVKTQVGIPEFCSRYIRILAKREIFKKLATRLVPFYMSRIQLDLTDKAGNRNITLKPRQIGSTTWHILVRLFLPAILEPGSSGLLISQTKPYGAQHFRILQRALKNFGVNGQTTPKKTIMSSDMLKAHLLHTQYSARHEIVFDFLDSKVLVDTAENPDAGTGLTINHLVGTEVAYWMRDPETLLAQAKEAVPQNGTVDYESTPNGMGGYFFEEWQRAQAVDAEFRSHFYPWWWQEEYEESPAAKPDSMTEEEEKFQKEYDWTMKQLAWRRKKMISLRSKFPEKYPEDSQLCFLTSGDLFFDRDILRDIKMNLAGTKPIEKFHSGTLKIYRRRIKGRRYLVAIDAAEGKLVSSENADSNSMVVMDVDSGEECAAYRSKLPPEELASDAVDLAQMYNGAILCPERNGPGQSVILTVQRQLLYGNLYMHKEWHRERKQVIPVAGFPTTNRTRPIALNKLSAMLRDAPELWHDEPFINQCLTFIWSSTNKQKLGGVRKPAAAPGCHDDDVSARWVGAYCRLVLLGYLDPVEVPSERYGQIEDAEEDLDAA